MTVYLGSPHSAAFLSVLTATGEKVGDGTAPDGLTYDTEGRLVRAYAVVYVLGSAVFDGSVKAGEEQADAWPTIQVTSNGATRAQAEWLRDKLRAALLNQQLQVTGRRVGPVLLLDEQGVRPDYDVTPHVFYAVDRFRAYSTPTT